MKQVLLIVCCLSCVSVHAREDGKLYAVLVGVSEYRQAKNNLTYSHQDAIEMYNLLKLQTQEFNLKLLVNRQATKDHITETTRHLFTKVQPEDRVIFFFSGHGNRNCFYTHDQALVVDSLQAIFRECKARWKIILADACFSGTFRASGTEQEAPPAREDRDEHVLLFLSSRSDQTSKESQSLKNGLFTYFLMAGLKGGADRDRDRKVTARELFDFVHPRVKEQSAGKQVPVMWGQFEDDMVVMNWEK
ncbi:MAG: caspase family protein [Tannerella sp.]|nr:caspase family protein [Tannerella sp.]